MRTSPLDEATRRHEARRAAISFCALAAVSCVIISFALRSSGLPFRHVLPALVISVVGFVLASFRRTLARATSLGVIALAVFALLYQMWVNHAVYASAGTPFTAFAGHKVTALVVAFLAPSGGFGAALIVVVTVSPAIQYMLWPEDIARLVPALEPWPTVMIGVAALFVLRARRRWVRSMWAASRSHSQRIWLERVAQMSLALRDLLGTPLQTLTLAIGAVRQRSEHRAGVRECLDDLETATARLSHLGRLLEPLGGIASATQPIAGFDALESIEHKIADSSRGIASTAIASPGVIVASPFHEPRLAAYWMSWICAAVGLVFAILLDLQGIATWTAYAVAIAGVASMGVLLMRGAPSQRSSTAVLVFLSAVLLAASWIGSDTLASTGQPFSPFNALKLLEVALMLLAPAGRIGIALVAATTVLPLVQTLTWSAEVRARMPAIEPALTITLGLICIGTLVIRQRHTAMLRRALSERIESGWFERVARLVMLVRDLAERAVEVLRTCTPRLRELCNEPDAALGAMERAALKLSRIHDALAPLQPLLAPRAREPGIDDLEVVEREVEALVARASTDLPGAARSTRDGSR